MAQFFRSINAFNRKCVGVWAFQGETYLVGPDKRMRSDSYRRRAFHQRLFCRVRFCENGVSS
jgi:hypothetical protein